MYIKEKLKRIRCLRKLAVCYQNIRESHSFVTGKDNNLNISGVRVSSRICITGRGNIVTMGKGSLINKGRIWIFGNNNRLYIEDGAYIDEAILYIEGDGCSFTIGRKTYIGPSFLSVSEDGMQLSIGAGCMVSSNVQIRTGDSHSILDENGIRINRASSVAIGNHVWLGEGCKILKGTIIGENSIVATGAIVTKEFPNNVLLGGVPARIIKENVNWDSKRI